MYCRRPIASSSSSRGLRALVLELLLWFIYYWNLSEYCALCLSEFENGEMGRILPNCKHCFHTACVDMWFYKNSTCPLCRTRVQLPRFCT
ncbi:putative transcription factor C2H2 family [Helianthus anomalus]